MVNVLPPADLWEQVKERVRSHVNEQHYSTWFVPTAQTAFSGGVLTVSVPSKFARDWLTENFQVLIRETASAIAGRECTVVFQIAERAAWIAQGHFDTRLYTPIVHDEVGRMTMVLNSMLDRLQAAVEHTSGRHLTCTAE